MIATLDLVLTPEVASKQELHRKIIIEKLNLSNETKFTTCIRKKSIDARHGNVRINMRIEVGIDEVIPCDTTIPEYRDVSNGNPVHIIGAGPAGLFAALKVIELGCKPIVFERGKEVNERKKDIAILHRGGALNPESNYCFGEGGAGAFSDGKLYTRSKKRGDILKILSTLVNNGADESILYDAQPHIGTDKLPTVISTIRNKILEAGGEFHFETRIDDFEISGGKLKSIVTSKGEKIPVKCAIFAVGHSSHDFYKLLSEKNISLLFKPFAMGLRIEHPQVLIDGIQYGLEVGNEYLPPATYKLVTHVGKRGVFSFCMCPGGYIVPSSTTDGQRVVNGMSSSKRNSSYANSGIVAEVTAADLSAQFGDNPLAGMLFQQEVERLSGLNGGSAQQAPAQKLVDFLKNKLSSKLPENSYHPGLISSPIHFWLPEFITKTLQNAFPDFNKKMHGFVSSDALLVGVESRTSSPVTIPRDSETLQSPQIHGFFPCGEGAGFAGGIVSSAIDGERCAEQVVRMWG